MPAIRFVQVGLTLQLLLGACVSRADPSKDPHLEVVATIIGPDLASISVCFDLPSDADWVLGRLPGDVALLDASHNAPMRYFTLDSLEPASESRPARRCDSLVFELPAEFQATDNTLVVQRLAASLPQNPDWDELQRTLAEAAPGIVIEPLSGAEGLSFGLIDRPDDMTDLEAHNVVVGLAEPVVLGPWIVPVQFDE